MADGAGDDSRKRDQPHHVKVVDSYTRPSGGEAPPETRWRGRLRGSGDAKPAEAPPGPRTHIDVPDGRPTIVISEPGIDEEIAALEAAKAARRAEEEERARRAEEEAARRAEEEEQARVAEEEAARRAAEETRAAGDEEPEEPAGVGSGPRDFEAAAGATVLIDDLDGLDDFERAEGAQHTAAATGSRRRGPSPRVRRRRRVVAAATGVVVVGGGAAAAALTLLPVRASRSHPAAARTPTASTPSTTARPKPPAASSTTTTAAGPVGPSSTDAGGATWAAPAGSHAVTLNARGPCWVEVTAGPGGPVLSEETLAAGDVRTVNRPGPLWIRLGAAAEMTVTLDGRPLAVPAGVGDNPYNITIQSPG